MDLAKFISLISRKELFFATASSFDDIFEGAKGVEENKDKWDSFSLKYGVHYFVKKTFVFLW